MIMSSIICFRSAMLKSVTHTSNSGIFSVCPSLLLAACEKTIARRRRFRFGRPHLKVQIAEVFLWQGYGWLCYPGRPLISSEK